jgi:hypothetical protein
MTHRPTHSHTTVRRTLLALAAAASLALGLGTGCLDTGEDEGEFQAAINCNGLSKWEVGKTFKEGDVITFDNFGKDVLRPFRTSRTIRVDAFDWTPTNLPGFWTSAGSCGGALPPPAAPPPDNDGGGNNNGGGGNNNGGGGNNDPAPAPDNNFDQLKCTMVINGDTVPAPFSRDGGKNIGLFKTQFITGRCTQDSDCAGDGLCSKPCGICSGPAVCDAPGTGKLGCGFTCPGNSRAAGKCGQASPPEDGR